MILVGIDPGTETGFAVWDAVAQKLERVESGKIHIIMRETILVARRHAPVVVLFEDARRRRFFGKMDAKQAKYGAAVREGVGAVKRDCVIWEDCLADHQIPFEARNPVIGGTKWPSVQFAALTGWKDRTNEHARDAAFQVFGLSLLWAERAYAECSRRYLVTPRALKAAHS